MIDVLAYIRAIVIYVALRNVCSYF